MINGGSAKDFESKKGHATLASAFVLMLALSLSGQSSTWAAPTKSGEKKTERKADSKSEKNEAKKPEPVIENVVGVTTDQLVDKPHEWMNKNIKFTADFHAFSSIALDYKPAMRASKNYLSFLVFRPNSKIPYSELKLAMALPKDKDPENAVLTGLKEGDELEITGHVFATALDEPWVDVLKLKKIASAPDKKDDDQEKKADQASDKSDSEKKIDKLKGVKPAQEKTPDIDKKKP
jgi:hypothetical protein